jgi:hypothetical protein
MFINGLWIRLRPASLVMVSTTHTSSSPLHHPSATNSPAAVKSGLSSVAGKSITARPRTVLRGAVLLRKFLHQLISA